MKVAVVTGASRGIGRAIAEMLAEEGYSLALGARNVEELEKLTESLETEVFCHYFFLLKASPFRAGRRSARRLKAGEC